MPATTTDDTSRRDALALAGAAALSLLLSGCGGGDTEAQAEPAVAPTLALSSDTVGVAAGAFTVNFKFSAAVSAFGADRVLATGASVVPGSFATVSSTEYSIKLLPTANREGVAEITVPAGNFRDATGQAASNRAYSHAQAYDTVVASNEPVLSITDNVAGAAVATGPVIFTLGFSLAIRDAFSIASVVVAGGSITTFARVSPTLYNIVVTPPAATSGLMLLRVPVGAYTGDVAGVANTVESLAGVLFRT